MKKFLILIISLSFFAAACNTGGLFDFGGGVRGVFKSEDNGETFNSVDKLVKGGDISSLSVNALAYDSSKPDVLYAASAAGMYKTVNGGDSWTYILSGIGLGYVAIDNSNPSTLYAAGIVGTNGKIIKSVDGGVSWVDMYTEPSTNNTVLSIQVAENDSSLVLAGLLSGEVIRSTDGGRTWAGVRNFGDKIIQIKFGPTDTAYALTSTKGLYKSTDQGLTWTSMTDSIVYDTLNSVSQNASSVTVFYNLALDIRQSGVLYLGTEQGLFRSVNDGKNWSFLALPLKNAALRVSAVTVNPDDSNNLYASVASTIYKSVNGGATWETKVLPTAAFIHTIVVNPVSTNIIYLGLRSS